MFSPNKKHQFIWSSLQTVFFYSFLFVCAAAIVFPLFYADIVAHFICYFFYGPHFTLFVDFLLILSVAFNCVFVCVSDVFCILPLFEYATTDQKRININYMTKLNHRIYSPSNNDSTQLKAHRWPTNSFLSKTFCAYFFSLAGLRYTREKNVLRHHNKWIMFHFVKVKLATNIMKISQYHGIWVLIEIMCADGKMASNLLY